LAPSDPAFLDILIRFVDSFDHPPVTYLRISLLLNYPALLLRIRIRIEEAKPVTSDWVKEIDSQIGFGVPV